MGKGRQQTVRVSLPTLVDDNAHRVLTRLAFQGGRGVNFGKSTSTAHLVKSFLQPQYILRLQRIGKVCHINVRFCELFWMTMTY